MTGQFLYRRREFIGLLGGVAAWPLAARAQQRERMRRVGVLMNLAADDAEGQARLAAFLQGLQEAGWAVGRNVHIDLRWGAGDADRFRTQASELVTFALFRSRAGKELQNVPLRILRRTFSSPSPAPARTGRWRSLTAWRTD
jgi:hypothetical protein